MQLFIPRKAEINRLTKLYEYGFDFWRKQDLPIS